MNRQLSHLPIVLFFASLPIGWLPLAVHQTPAGSDAPATLPHAAPPRPSGTDIVARAIKGLDPRNRLRHPGVRRATMSVRKSLQFPIELAAFLASQMQWDDVVPGHRNRTPSPFDPIEIRRTVTIRADGGFIQVDEGANADGAGPERRIGFDGVATWWMQAVGAGRSETFALAEPNLADIATFVVHLGPMLHRIENATLLAEVNFEGSRCWYVRGADGPEADRRFLFDIQSGLLAGILSVPPPEHLQGLPQQVNFRRMSDVHGLMLPTRIELVGEIGAEIDSLDDIAITFEEGTSLECGAPPEAQRIDGRADLQPVPGPPDDRPQGVDLLARHLTLVGGIEAIEKMPGRTTRWRLVHTKSGQTVGSADLAQWSGGAMLTLTDTSGSQSPLRMGIEDGKTWVLRAGGAARPAEGPEAGLLADLAVLNREAPRPSEYALLENLGKARPASLGESAPRSGFWHVRAISQRGDIEELYFEIESGLLMNRSHREALDGKGITVVTEYGPYVEFGPLKLPSWTTTSGRGAGETRWVLEDATFECPHPSATTPPPEARALLESGPPAQGRSK